MFSNVVASGALSGKAKRLRGKGKGVAEGNERMSVINIHCTHVRNSKGLKKESKDDTIIGVHIWNCKNNYSDISSLPLYYIYSNLL